jgi:TRAP-type uncharacterized transport system substrate-binding protein
MSHPSLDQFGLYTKARIPSGLYDSVSGSTATYKVDNVLATYAFKNQFQTEITELVTCLSKNINKLQTIEGFHPKWRDVTIEDIDRIKWPAHPAAVAAIKRFNKK